MKYALLILSITIVFSIHAQDSILDSSLLADEAVENAAPLQNGFSTILLGTKIDDVKELLHSDLNFFYRGDPDVSLTPGDNNNIIKVEGRGFLSKGVFHFKENVLISIVLYFNPEKLDYYSLYSQLNGKYGKPDDLNPKSAYWEDENVRLILEKPLSLQYLDKQVYDELIESSAIQDSIETMQKDRFLNQL